jgi:serine/threonine protein kinase
MWWVKIADFGISKHLEMGNHTTTGIKGSLDFMAPELLLGKRDKASLAARDHFKTDIWAVGCIIYYLLTKKSPFSDFDTLIDYRQGESQCPASGLGEELLSDVGKGFLTSLLSIKPATRPTAQEAQKHSWFLALHQFYAEIDDEAHRFGASP